VTVRALFPLLQLLGALIGAAAFVAVVAAGWDYYTLSPIARLLHPRHDVLRPSGSIGLSCGVAGTILLLFNLSYLVRKNFARARVGSLRAWMALHVASGLAGTALIVLHSAMLPRSPVGLLALAGLLVVVVTGLVGRYIYAHLPRSPEGLELRLEDARQQLAQHRARLEYTGVDAGILDAPPRTKLPESGLLVSLWRLVAGDRAARNHFRRVRARLPSAAVPLARRYCHERDTLARLAELRALMGSWRFLHRWLAIAMMVLAAVHIALAVLFGDLWIVERWL